MKLRLIPALLPVLFLAGCHSDTPTPPIVAAATPPSILHSVNRYELHGSPDKVALLVDSETGNVWRYKIDSGKDEFVSVPVAHASTKDDGIDEYVRDESGKLVLKPKGTATP